MEALRHDIIWVKPVAVSSLRMLTESGLLHLKNALRSICGYMQMLGGPGRMQKRKTGGAMIAGGSPRHEYEGADWV